MTIVACIVGAMTVAERREAARKCEQRLELIKANLADLVRQDGLFVTHFGRPRFDGDPDFQSYIWPPTDIDDKAGKPLCSWRVRVDSSVIRGYWNEERPELNYAAMTLPWDSAHNLAYSDEGGGCGGMFDAGNNDGMAHVFAIAGPDTALDPMPRRRRQNFRMMSSFSWKSPIPRRTGCNRATTSLPRSSRTEAR
jgi:hypothetical protein